MKTKFVSQPWIIGMVLVLLLMAALTYWQLSPVVVVAEANASREFQADCQYSVFRQILIRTNATKSIVENGGMELIDQKTNDIRIDASNDRRPILNAIRGKSQSELDATKILTVRLTDPQLNANQLKLKQNADINNESLTVNTNSIEAAGNLKKYQTTLQATAKDSYTDVQLRVAMKVELSVPRLFASQAQAQVQAAAEKGLTDQENALKTLVAEHADTRIIVPDLD